jgi:hypothetical protein
VIPGWTPADGLGVSLAQFNAWSRVNTCEESGDWHTSGAEYSGGLGISTVNWDAYGGSTFGPESLATPDEQIVIAERIQAYPPDQSGCAAW